MAELTVPQINFAPLGQLGNVYQEGVNKRGVQDAFAGGVPNDAQGLASLAAKVGQYNPQLGMSLSQLAHTYGRDSKNDARQAERDRIGDQHWQASFGLQQRAADRADDPTPTNFVKDANAPGGYRPIGPADPAYIESISAAKARAAAQTPPEGFTRGPDGVLAPIPGGPTDPNYIGASEAAKAKAKAGAGGSEYGLQPVWGVGADGKPALVQLSKEGKTLQPQMPDGFQIARDPIKVDAGTHIILLDPQTRQQIGTMPKDVAGVEREKEKGSAQGVAEVALPTVIANSQQILNTIDSIEKHPGKKYSLGMYSKIPTVPGTPQADFRANLDQLNGQTFLQAYQTLKGGGAITDIEGAKGSNALARMQTAQSEASFNAALEDFKKVVKGGVERAKAKAGQPQAAAPQSPALADPLGIR